MLRPMNRLRAGIIGLGVGEKHVLEFTSHPQCEVVAVCDLSGERLSNFRKQYPTIKTIDKADTLLEDESINVVSIASYDNYHFDQVMKALSNGKHVFVEKPMCFYREEALRIRQFLNEKPSMRLSSNLNLRTCPRFKRLKQQIKEGTLGDIYYLEGDYLWGRLNKLTEGWRGSMDFYSIILGAAIHMIDLTCWLMEDERVCEVFAYGNRIASLNAGFRYNDFAAILMKFSNGVLAKITGNGGCVFPHFHQLAVYGTKATFIQEVDGAKLYTSRDARVAPQVITEEYPGRRKGDMITSFIDSILDEGRAPEMSSEDVFKAMAICFAAEESVQTGKPAPVKYI